ncbi:MAG: hypothetical protein JF611_09855 [Betaproteobacteria bacterium]|jgi:hypothetical protein|nr:hypothetical protein [Betaproteobacteria bacterium]
MSGEPEFDLFGALVFWGTPLAIVLWLALRYRHGPQADLRPGFRSLSIWFLVLFLSFAVGVGSLGGHTGGLANVYFALVGAASAVMLWFLYWKIGVRPRRKRSR